jgi:hypothetical protein
VLPPTFVEHLRPLNFAVSVVSCSVVEPRNVEQRLENVLVKIVMVTVIKSEVNENVSSL